MRNTARLALILIHIGAPAISVVFFSAPTAWLFTALLFSLAVGFLSRAVFSPGPVVAFCVLSGIWAALNLLLGASYYVQGEGFNDQFFYHLDSGTLAIAARSYGVTYYSALVVFVLALILPWPVMRGSGQSTLPRPVGALMWLVAIVSNYPLWSLAGYSVDLRDRPQGSFEHSRELSASEKGYLQALAEREGSFRQKNIILIYAESLEQLYFDQKVVKADLLPRLREQAREAHNFINVRQVAGTSATITGIIASQCGFPVHVGTHLAVNSTISSVEKPYADETCLADILAQHDYQTVYMGGAPLSFAGKGAFLQTHGYQQVYGESDLAPRLADPGYRHGWGLYDDSLFDMALDKLHELESAPQPYLLTVLTLDTHHPNGYLSRSCKKNKGLKTRMARAIHCSDQLISQFIEDAMASVDMENTIIVLFSDHLSMRNSFWDVLRKHQRQRRLSFMIFDDEAGSTSKVRGTHLDVAPTILEAAGLPGSLKVGGGSSLFYLREQGRVRKENGETVVPVLLTEQASARDSGVTLSAIDKTITVGGTTFKASAEGREFETGMYLVVLDDDGRPQDAVYSADYTTLVDSLEGRFVVGISVFSESRGRPSYFYGRLTWEGELITQKSLRGDVEISAAEVGRGLDTRGEKPQLVAGNKFQVRRVAHGGGALGGLTVTNSYQALTQNFKRGFRYFEIDFNFTSDNQLVCIHDWDGAYTATFGGQVDGRPSLAVFDGLARQNEKFTSCTLEGLAQWMRENPGAYVVTDVKERNMEALEQIIATLPQARRRVIPQIYQDSSYTRVKAMGFEQIIFTLYRFEGNTSQLISAVKSWEGNFAVTMPIGRARSGLGRQLHSLGIPSYVHTVNEAIERDELMGAKGISEIYTDFLVPGAP